MDVFLPIDVLSVEYPKNKPFHLHLLIEVSSQGKIINSELCRLFNYRTCVISKLKKVDAKL